MGCAASLGLGLSLVRPDKKVIVIDGDGAALMRLGNMATVGAYAGNNYYHLLLDNHVHESTGGQGTVSSTVDFPAVAAACGYQSIFHATSRFPGKLKVFCRQKHRLSNISKPDRVSRKACPRPSVKPASVARRLMQHLDVNTPWISLQ